MQEMPDRHPTKHEEMPLFPRTVCPGVQDTSEGNGLEQRSGFQLFLLQNKAGLFAFA